MSSSRYRTHLLMAVLLFPVTGNTGSITTPGILTSTTNAAINCMRWMPIGACFWLHI